MKIQTHHTTPPVPVTAAVVAAVAAATAGDGPYYYGGIHLQHVQKALRVRIAEQNIPEIQKTR